MPLPEARRTQDVERDPVVQHEAARFEQAIDLAEVPAVATGPHVLEHPDARDLVVELALRQILVVDELDAHAVAEAARLDLARHVLELVLRQRDARRVDAVVLRRPEDQASPAAADVEERFARTKPELPADVVELSRLSVGERIALGGEVRARVNHPRIEPQPVERVRDIVVMRDVLAVAAVLVPERAPPRAQRLAAMGDRPDHRLGDVEDAPRPAGEVDLVAHVGTREPPELGRRQGPQRPPRADDDLDLGRRRQRNPATVGQHQSDGELATAVAIRDDLLERFGHRGFRKESGLRTV